MGPCAVPKTTPVADNHNTNTLWGTASRDCDSGVAATNRAQETQRDISVRQVYTSR